MLATLHRSMRLTALNKAGDFLPTSGVILSTLADFDVAVVACS
jgi:hypothetical protein